MVDVLRHLDRYAAQNQQPQYHHQRQVEAAEAGGIQRREGEIQRAAAGHQPYLVAVPYRTDVRQHRLALRLIARHKQVDRAGAQIEAIQHHVNGDHRRRTRPQYQTVPP